MADDGSVADKPGECVNLLYLASKQREKSQVTPSGSMETITADPPKPPTAAAPAPTVSSGGDTAPVSRMVKSSTSSDDREVVRICPKVNCVEKIILCLDMSEEMDKVSFRSRAGDKFAPLKLVKRAVGIFLHSKHKLNPNHEFALMILRESAIMMSGFTNNPDKIIGILQELENGFPGSEKCDLATVFDAVQQSVQLPHVSDPTVIPPPYVVRTVLVYGRSHCVPKMSSRKSLNMLMTSPHFFLDVFYIHEPPSDENNCEEIFDFFCELDEKGLFYIFEVSRNPTRLYDCMAQLLPHPLQRPIQTDTSYKIDNKPPA